MKQAQTTTTTTSKRPTPTANRIRRRPLQRCWHPLLAACEYRLECGQPISIRKHHRNSEVMNLDRSASGSDWLDGASMEPEARTLTLPQLAHTFLGLVLISDSRERKWPSCNSHSRSRRVHLRRNPASSYRHQQADTKDFMSETFWASALVQLSNTKRKKFKRLQHANPELNDVGIPKTNWYGLGCENTRSGVFDKLSTIMRREKLGS